MSTAQALEGSHARQWSSDQPAWYIIRYSPSLWKDKENRALSVIYKYLYKTETRKASKCLSLPLTFDYVLLASKPKKSEQDCF